MANTVPIQVKILPIGVITHDEDMCWGEYCVLHKPSDHKMKDWTINIRLDREFALAERMCKHGIGHPDPDSLAFIAGQMRETGRSSPEHPYGIYESDIHGCDGCCG